MKSLLISGNFSRNIYKSILIFLFTGFTYSCSNNGRSGVVQLIFDRSVPQAVYASEKLKEALTDNGYSVPEGQAGNGFTINMLIDQSKLGSEAYSIELKNNNIVITEEITGA